MSNYDNWKTSPPENEAEIKIHEDVYDLDDVDVLLKCEVMGINIDDEMNEIRERLVVALIEDMK